MKHNIHIWYPNYDVQVGAVVLWRDIDRCSGRSAARGICRRHAVLRIAAAAGSRHPVAQSSTKAPFGQVAAPARFAATGWERGRPVCSSALASSPRWPPWWRRLAAGRRWPRRGGVAARSATFGAPHATAAAGARRPRSTRRSRTKAKIDAFFSSYFKCLAKKIFSLHVAKNIMRSIALFIFY